MKAFILTSAAHVYAYTSLLESAKYWLVPNKDGAFDIFSKDVFTLTVEEVQEPQAAAIGFSENNRRNQ